MRGRRPGAAFLAGSPYLAGLTGLYLDDNGIGNRGAYALARSPHLARLESLDLRGNRVRNAGAGAFATSPHTGRLQALLLWDNNISPAGEEPLKVRFGDRVHLRRPDGPPWVKS